MLSASNVECRPGRRAEFQLPLPHWQLPFRGENEQCCPTFSTGNLSTNGWGRRYSGAVRRWAVRKAAHCELHFLADGTVISVPALIKTDFIIFSSPFGLCSRKRTVSKRGVWFNIVSSSKHTVLQRGWPQPRPDLDSTCINVPQAAD